MSQLLIFNLSDCNGVRAKGIGVSPLALLYALLNHRMKHETTIFLQFGRGGSRELRPYERHRGRTDVHLSHPISECWEGIQLDACDWAEYHAS